MEGAPGNCCGVPSLALECSERLATVPAFKRAQFGQAVTLLASRIGVALAIGRLTPFANLSESDRRRCVAAWSDSLLPIVRSAVQAVRKLVLATYYGTPGAAQAIGYPGAFRLRQPRVAWEGPLPPSAAAAAAEDAGPVSRTPVSLPVTLPPDPLPAGVFTAAAGPEHRRADVVVIGSGAGGAVAAATLAEAGFEVVILESGGWHTRADFNEDEAAMAATLFAEGALRTTDDGSVALLQGETVGGSTTVNWMLMLRTPDFVLDQWARESGVTGMSPREMAPVFGEIEQFVHAAPVPDEAHSANNRLILDGARALNWKARGGVINAKGCVRCGLCSAGCRHDAKQSALVTWLPRALAAGATLHANAFVQRLEVRERDTGAASGSGTGSGTPPLKRVHVTSVDAAGAPTAFTVDAPIVIVAGGAVGTPALLQRSGLGGGGVGQFLRLHPVAFSFGVYGRDIAAGTGIPMTTLCDEHLHWEGTDYGFWIETPPVAPWFAAVAVPSFGHAHGVRMAQYNRLGVLLSLTRDGAERAVSSGRVSVNRRGETSIRYRLTREDARRVRASLGAMAQLHFAAGAEEVFTGHAVPRVARRVADIPQLMDAPMGPNQLAIGSAHVNGTCRMGTDARTSGATPDGERHGVRGLYISDGSLLPTALGVNPQATIMAVTRVLAGRIADRHAGVARS
jgi:choline dehydrogenase-like flavoprotein